MKQINVFTAVIKILSEIGSIIDAGAPPNSILKNLDTLHIYQRRIDAGQNLRNMW